MAAEERLQRALLGTKLRNGQREAIAKPSIEQHQAQQAKIDRLRVDQLQVATMSAETRPRLDFMVQSLTDAEHWVALTADTSSV
jgi:hypothetical protein